MPLRTDRLRQMREQRGLTQRKLAELCGVTLFQISRYENGKSEPGASIVEALARHLNVSTDYLLGLTDHPNGFHGEVLRGDQSRLLEAYEAGDGITAMELVTARMRQLEGEKDKAGGK